MTETRNKRLASLLRREADRILTEANGDADVLRRRAAKLESEGTNERGQQRRKAPVRRARAENASQRLSALDSGGEDERTAG